MKGLAVVFSCLLVGASAAGAEPAQPGPLDVFLEQRVVQELAADGIMLARLEVTLDVETIGDKLLVSLVDARTGKATASTKIDAVPADREAAVALTTQVVANLAVQIGAVRPPIEAPPAPPPAPVNEELRAREIAEVRYATESIGKDARGRRYHGELKTRLTRPVLYDLVGRDDLAKNYRDNSKAAKTAFVVGLVLIGSATILASAALTTTTLDAETLETECADTCTQFAVASVGVAVSGGIVLAVAAHYRSKRDPNTEADVDNLADEYNQKLRRQLGLPTASRHRDRPRVHDVAWAPQLYAGGGGLTVLGRF